MASACKIMAQWLVDRGFGVYPPNPANAAIPWQITYTKMTSDPPDRKIATKDSGGATDGRQADTDIIHPLVQIMLRCAEPQYDETEAKGKAIQVALAQIKNRNTSVVVDGTTYVIQSATVYIPLVPLGQEEQNKRWNFAINVRLTI